MNKVIKVFFSFILIIFPFFIMHSSVSLFYSFYNSNNLKFFLSSKMLLNTRVRIRILQIHKFLLHPFSQGFVFSLIVISTIVTTLMILYHTSQFYLSYVIIHLLSFLVPIWDWTKKEWTLSSWTRHYEWTAACLKRYSRLLFLSLKPLSFFYNGTIFFPLHSFSCRKRSCLTNLLMKRWEMLPIVSLKYVLYSLFLYISLYLYF